MLFEEVINMIFLSHQHKDKEFIQEIAQTLKDVFGEEKVFYDSWSIKPGDNIIKQMNNGLENCKYFFFFITENSLQSEMVLLEWTSSLMMKDNRDIKFIPIRAENVDVPMVIAALKYLDLYNNGLEVVKTQMIELITGEEQEKYYPVFTNLQAHVLQEGEDKIRFFVTVKKFYEPNSKFVLATNLNQEEATFGISNGMQISNFYPDMATIDGQVVNGFFISSDSGVHKGFRYELVLTTKTNKSAIIYLYHVKSETNLELIPTTPINSIEQLSIL